MFDRSRVFWQSEQLFAYAALSASCADLSLALFLTAARAALAGSAGLIVLLLDLHAGALFDVSHDAVAMASACTIRPVCRRRAAVARADMITFRYLVAFRKHIDKRAGQR